ncbi:MAG: SocA family protein [Verrucomicrobia bacterium]|nr:SocA family protein [Verrucomicrobiota bacterium]
MRISFNETKATQTAAYLLQLRGGTMSYMKLIKLLYIVDREALLRWGRTVTTDCHVSMDRGPVLSQTLDLITDEARPDRSSVWTQHISEPDHYQVRLLKDAGLDELSKAEVALLDEVFEKFGAMNRWKLVDLAHAFPEWQDPQGGAIPITYRDILKAGGKTDLEIAAIEDELDNLALSDKLLSAN